MWLLPSYSRPEKVHALTLHNTTRSAPITLRLHDTDPKLQEYLEIKFPEAWTVVVGPTLKLGPTWNWAVKEYPDETFYGFLGDDCIPSPLDWYTQLESAAGTRYIAYPNDTIHGENLCTHPCVGGDFIRSLGWWANPGLEHSFIDTSLYVLGLRTGLLRYVPEVIMEHRHPLKDETLMDETYKRGQESFVMDEYHFKKWIKSNVAFMDLRRLERGLNLGTLSRNVSK